VTEIIVFPIPIRPDIVVQVQMPVDLTAAEGKRVARVVAAMPQPKPSLRVEDRGRGDGQSH
jgi:hypothetical protein